MKTNSSTAFSDQLDYLKLPFIKNHHSELAGEAARQTWDHQEYLRRLVDGEFGHRQQRSIERRIKAARFPVLKTLEHYRWDWPKKINRLQIQNLFRLEFIPQRATSFFLKRLELGNRT
jgi:DNA replication protein DnaC